MVLQLYRTLKMCQYLPYTRQKSSYAAAVSSFIRKNEAFWAHQQSLPKLPVPPLQSSLELYLSSVRPLLSEEEYARTVKIVKNFGSPTGLGAKLHKLLEEKAHKVDNWLDEWWMNGAYLECRLPLVGNSTPAVTVYYEELIDLGDHLKVAARFVAAMLEFKNLIDNFQVPFEKLGNQPLDMSHIFRLFYTCRVPEHTKDSVEFFGDKAPGHIVLAHNNHFFRIDAYDEKGKPLTEEQLLIQFRKCLDHSQSASLPVGALTSMHRDKWAKSYHNLKNYSSTNEEYLDDIRKSLFILCLDKPSACPADRKRTRFALQSLHGFGTDENGGCRWYDKALQFVVGEDGCIGYVIEHTGFDGSPMIPMLMYIKNYLLKVRGKLWSSENVVAEPKQLCFKLSSDIIQDIDEAEKNLKNIVDDIDALCFNFESYDSQFIKHQRLSPDSFIQMAIQLTFYKIHGCPTAAYESAAMRKFLNGRTETIRSTSVESVRFCQMMMDPSSSYSAKIAAMKEAVENHKKYAIRAVNGLGIDRLLLGLRKISEENGIPTPDIFLDAGYTRSTHFQLSTSQVSSKEDAFALFGPVVLDGYGCWYDPHSMRFGVTSLKSSPFSASANDFKNALNESLTEMRDLLMKQHL